MADFAIFTRGDQHNCKCPYCGENNHDIPHGNVPTFGRFTVFSKPCFYCKKIVWYTAQWAIEIIAEKSDPLFRSSEKPINKEGGP